MNDREGHPASPAADRPKERGRRAYSSPKLVEYGSVAKLTQSGGSTMDEGSVIAKQMKCL